MKLAVVGSRSFTDKATVFFFLDAYRETFGDKLVIVSGGCPNGPDNHAEMYGWKHDIPLQIYLPDWDKYGKGAGFIRNSEIVENCDEVIAFWDRKSNGTRDTIRKAEKKNKEVIIVDKELTLPAKTIKLLIN